MNNKEPPHAGEAAPTSYKIPSACASHADRRFIDSETLKEIRQNTDCRELFTTLGLKKDEKKSKADDRWAFSPISRESNAASTADGETYAHQHHADLHAGLFEAHQKRDGQSGVFVMPDLFKYR